MLVSTAQHIGKDILIQARLENDTIRYCIVPFDNFYHASRRGTGLYYSGDLMI